MGDVFVSPSNPSNSSKRDIAGWQHRAAALRPPSAPSACTNRLPTTSNTREHTRTHEPGYWCWVCVFPLLLVRHDALRAWGAGVLGVQLVRMRLLCVPAPPLISSLSRLPLISPSSSSRLPFSLPFVSTSSPPFYNTHNTRRTLSLSLSLSPSLSPSLVVT